MSTQQLRPSLGDFNSIICFKAVVVGIEDALGNAAAGVALKAAGRKRGAAVANALGLAKGDVSLADAAGLLRAALGADGTRLCNVDQITEVPGEEGPAYQVFLSETVCSAGEPPGSPRELTFTLGAVHGAMEVALGRKLRGKQVGSVLRGATHDIIAFTQR